MQASPLTDKCPQRAQMGLVKFHIRVELIISVQWRRKPRASQWLHRTMDGQEGYSHQHFVCRCSVSLLYCFSKMKQRLLFSLKLEQVVGRRGILEVGSVTRPSINDGKERVRRRCRGSERGFTHLHDRVLVGTQGKCGPLMG
jgi:hypothetical protein